jgi:DNA-binding HxlR family transcriptional regulator
MVETVIDVEKIVRAIAKSQGIKILKAQKEGAKTPKELTFETFVDKGVVLRRLKEFKEVGLVERTFDERDENVKYKLTNLGQRVLRLLSKRVNSLCECKEIKDFVSKVISNLDSNNLKSFFVTLVSSHKII